MEKTCQYCGKTYQVKPCLADGSKFCSRACHDKGKTYKGRSVHQKQAAIALRIGERLSIRDISDRLGVSYATVRNYVRDHPLTVEERTEILRRKLVEYNSLFSRPKVVADRTWTDEQLRVAVAESVTVAEVMRKLGVVTSSANHGRVLRDIRRVGVDTAHFLGKRWGIGKVPPGWEARDLKDVLVVGAREHTSHLKKRLLEEGLKKALCEECGIVTWNGKPAPLTLHHVNGNRLDNRIENLQILCANCHAQTATFGRRKRSAG